MTVLFAPATDDPQVLEYNDFVASHPNGTLMQAPAWAHVKNTWTADYVILRGEAGEIKAGMQVLSINNPVGGALLYANRGPVVDPQDTDSFEQLMEEAKQIIEARNGFLLRLDPAFRYDSKLVSSLRERGYMVASTEVADKHYFTNSPLTMILDLRGKSFEDVLAGFSSRFRGKLNKSYRNGLSTSFIAGNSVEAREALDIFYSLYQITGARQGFGIRPKDYYWRILEGFGECAYVALTSSAEGDPLAATLLVNYGHKSMYLFAASSNELRQFNPSVQLNVECIKLAVEQGLSEYDMGGLWSFTMDDGLYRFKREICGDEGAVEYLGEIDIVVDTEKYRAFVG